jgi:hypothetical protein
MWLLILFFLFCYILFLFVSGSQPVKRQSNDREQYWPPYEPSVSPEIPVDFSDPNTSPETLLAVGNSSLNPAILRLVAGNPNTPIELLLRLFSDFPNEVRSNSIFALLQLENPAFLSDVNYLTVLKVLESPNIPAQFIDSTIYHSNIRVTKKLLEIATLSENNLENLIGRIQDDDMAKMFLQHKNCTDSVKHLIVQRGNERFKQALAENCLNDREGLPIEILGSLVDNSSIDIQMFIVRHSRTIDALLNKLLSPKNQELQYRLAKENGYSYCRRNHYAPLADRVVLRLAHNQVANIADRITIRQALAESDIIPAMLTLISQDTYEKVRCTVAAMADLPSEILLHLAQDKSDRVQRKLLKNLEISSEFLLLIAQDKNLRRQELAAQHQNTPIEVLKILAENPQLHAHIARNPRTPTKILQRLAEQGDQDIALTQNPTIPDEIVQPVLEKLSKSRRYTVRKLVARHPQVTQQILERLAKDHEPKINQLAQERSQDYLTATDPTTPPDILWQLLLKYKGKSIQPKAIRRSIACNPNASGKILLELVREFTQEVLENPIFALLQLEDPELDFINQIAESRLVDILRRNNVAQIFIDGAINSPHHTVIVALLRIDDLPESYLERLIPKMRYGYDSELLVRHRNFTPRLQSIAAQFGSEILKRTMSKTTNNNQ